MIYSTFTNKILVIMFTTGIISEFTSILDLTVKNNGYIIKVLNINNL